MATTITTTKSDLTTTVEYENISLNNNEAIYRDGSSSRAEPSNIRIASSYSSKDDSDRVLVERAATQADTDGDNRLAKCHLVMTIPRAGFSEAEIKDMLFELTKLCEDKFADLYAGLQPTD